MFSRPSCDGNQWGGGGQQYVPFTLPCSLRTELLLAVPSRGGTRPSPDLDRPSSSTLPGRSGALGGYSQRGSRPRPPLVGLSVELWWGASVQTWRLGPRSSLRSLRVSLLVRCLARASGRAAETDLGTWMDGSQRIEASPSKTEQHKAEAEAEAENQGRGMCVRYVSR